ncbi:MAG: cytochrome c [Methylotenera sp.]|nr:cytochrome c [Methylotenera sp.]
MLGNFAYAESYQSADARAGQVLIEKYCVSCHAESFSDNGSEIYTRESREVNSSKDLVTKIRNCNTMLGLKWFEDEEQNVSIYLN